MGGRTRSVCSVMALAAVLAVPPVWAQEQSPPPEVSLTPPIVERDATEMDEAPAAVSVQEIDSEAQEIDSEAEAEAEVEVTADEDSKQEEPTLAISADPAAFAA